MKSFAYREVKRKLEAAGFIEVGQTGSHVKFTKKFQKVGSLQSFQSTAK